jgi:hypothetical protein
MRGKDVWAIYMRFMCQGSASLSFPHKLWLRLLLLLHGASVFPSGYSKSLW